MSLLFVIVCAIIHRMLHHPCMIKFKFILMFNIAKWDSIFDDYFVSQYYVYALTETNINEYAIFIWISKCIPKTAYRVVFCYYNQIQNRNFFGTLIKYI